MYIKIFVNLILILALATIQLSFLSGLPLGIGSLNLTLIVLIFIMVMGGLDMALWWTAGVGVMLDIFSFLPFGTYMLSLLAAAVIIHFLLVGFFTNRSLYSFLALTFFGTAAYEFFLNSTAAILSGITGREFSVLMGKEFWKGELSQMALNIAGAFLVFYALNFLTNKMKPVFLADK